MPGSVRNRWSNTSGGSPPARSSAVATRAACWIGRERAPSTGSRNHSQDGIARRSVGDGCTHSRTGGSPLAGWPGSALAEAVHERAERPERLLTGHLLLDDRRHERLHDEVGRPQPPVGVAPPGHRDRLVERHEAGRVVVGAEHPGQLGQDPLRPAPPGRTCDLARQRVGQEPQRRRPLRGADAPPDRAVGGAPERRVTGPSAMRRQDRADRARPVRPPDPDERCCRGGHLCTL